MIEFCDVCAGYDGSPVVDHVSFSVRDGGFTALAGTNGAGKSTVLRLANGLLKPQSGHVEIDGAPTDGFSAGQLAARIGFLFQNPDRQICCSAIRDELLFGFRAQGVPCAPGSDAYSQVDDVIGRFGFDPDADPFQQSRGTRQLIALAGVLATRPRILLLDEPTTGLDSRECELAMSEVARLNADGTSVLMVSHDMELVADWAQRLIVMHEGRIVAEGPVFDVMRNAPAFEAASLLPSQIVGVSLGLAAEGAISAQSPVARANTLGQMEEAVLAAADRPHPGEFVCASARPCTSAQPCVAAS